MRRLVEQRLKNGQIKAVVATGSLELGIDIGPLDEVAMLGSPASPSAALQRAGRAGHRPNEASIARIYPTNSKDLLSAVVLARMAENGELEELRIPENPLDMLSREILALCCIRGRTEDQLFNAVRQCWSFRNLPRPSFDSVLAMLRGRYAETRLPALRPKLYRDEGVLVSRPGTRLQLYTGGAIPDLGFYQVRAVGEKGILGALDEKFVWESQPGMVFHLGNRRWKIMEIDDKQVSVQPTEEPENTEPFWRAEARSRDAAFAGRIAGFLEEAEEILETSAESKDSDTATERLSAHLVKQWNMGESQARSLSEYLQSQRRRSGAPLPHGSHIIAEITADPAAGSDPHSRTLILHTVLGARVNRPLALALQAAWAAISPIPVIPTVDDDTITCIIPVRDTETFINLLYSISKPEESIRPVLEATPFFGGRFREAAGRSMLLPPSNLRRRQPLWITRQRSRAIMEAIAPYPDFPILTETWRTCLNDEFDMDALGTFLDNLASGSIRLSKVETPAPSPFASSVMGRRLAQGMQSNMKDQSDARFTSGLKDEEIRRLSRSSSLRPRIPKRLIDRLEQRRRRLEEGYAPTNTKTLKAWLEEREAFTLEEWTALVQAAASESAVSPEKFEKACIGGMSSVRLGPSAKEWLVTKERAAEWEEAFSSAGWNQTAPPDTVPVESAARLAAFWLSGRGPKPVRQFLETFGLEESPFAPAWLESLADSGLILDRISEGDGEAEIADSEGLEILLRWRRREARNTDAPLPAHRLAPFLAVRQGLTSPLRGTDGVVEVLGRLEGLPLPASLWESSVLPVRVASYIPAHLDTAADREEIVWVGHGTKKIVYLTAEGGWRYPKPAGSVSSDVFPGPGEPPRSFWDISDALGEDSAAATDAIWKRVWTGGLTCPDIRILRSAVSAGFRAAAPAAGSKRPVSGGLRGWKTGRPISGRWYCPSYAEEPEDPMESSLLMRERIRLLALRYGILSRPILEKEIPAWRWPALASVLHLMELSDELIGGRWFEELPMPQFLLPECLPLWRRGAAPERPWVMDASDPASPSGVLGTDIFPARREGTWTAWDEDGRLSCVLKPASKTLEIPQAGSHTPAALASLAQMLTERPVSPLTRLVVKRCNGNSVDAGIRPILEKAGFTPKGPEEWVYRPRPIGMQT